MTEEKQKLVEHKLIGTHTEDLAGGRTLSPGEVADVDVNDEHNVRLIDDGKLIPTEAGQKSTKSKQVSTTEEKEGDS